MTSYRLHLVPFLLLAAGLAHAAEIYHWVDEDGIAHYSQTPPADAAVEVETRQLDASTPQDYDPDEYEYSVMNQAERIHAEWAELMAAREAERDARREAERERRAYERRYPERYGWRYGREIHYPGLHSRPPLRPGHQVRRYQFERLDELGLWREPPAYSINSSGHRQRVEQTRSLALPGSRPPEPR